MNLINYKEKLTVIVVTYHSSQIIENLINKIEKSIKILIIENSLDHNLKEQLEKKFNNVEVIIPHKNLGVGGAINLGFSKVKTKFSLHLSADTDPDEDMINILLSHAEKIKNFSMLAPKIKNFEYKNNLYIEKNDNKKIHKMRYIIGAALLFNMNSLKKIGYFDENIFLYYEELDLYFRCLKLGFNIYMIDDAKIVHHGSASINKEFSYKISLIRNWHYCWSKFYYFKKNFGYLYGIKKTIPNFIRALKKYILCLIKGDKNSRLLHKAEIQGLVTSYLLKKSSRRPDIKN